MANDQNLIPFSKMSSERHRELSRKGGKRSGEVRRRKRDNRWRVAVEHETFGFLAKQICEETIILNIALSTHQAPFQERMNEIFLRRAELQYERQIMKKRRR